MEFIIKNTDQTKKEGSYEVQARMEALSSFVSLRAQAVSSQLNGDNTAVDTGDLSLSDMGTMGGGMGGNMRGTPTGSFSEDLDILSMLTLSDKDGNEVDISTLIDDTSSITGAMLSDGTEIDFSSSDFKTLMQTDFSNVVTFTCEDGTGVDISGYTVSVSRPSQKSGDEKAQAQC